MLLTRQPTAAPDMSSLCQYGASVLSIVGAARRGMVPPRPHAWLGVPATGVQSRNDSPLAISLINGRHPPKARRRRVGAHPRLRVGRRPNAACRLVRSARATKRLRRSGCDDRGEREHGGGSRRRRLIGNQKNCAARARRASRARGRRRGEAVGRPASVSNRVARRSRSV
jgi:hypothetical protein